MPRQRLVRHSGHMDVNCLDIQDFTVPNAAHCAKYTFVDAN